MLPHIILQKPVERCRRRHTQQHTADTHHTAADRHCRQHPDSRQADGGTDYLRIDQVAFQLLQDAKNRGVYQSFVMDEIFQKLEGGNAAIGAYYAGDYLTMLENNEDLAFVVPEEGSNWFMDAMCVLKDAPHYNEAMAWINFIASTEANLANMDYLWYASPNQEALEQYPAYYEELYEEELGQETYDIIAAPQEVLDRCEAYLVLPLETRKLYNDLWTELGI